MGKLFRLLCDLLMYAFVSKVHFFRCMFYPQVNVKCCPESACQCDARFSTVIGREDEICPMIVSMQLDDVMAIVKLPYLSYSIIRYILYYQC